MDPVVKERWVEALRSGEYEQGKDGLRNSKEQYCCLGILCNLWAGEWKENASYNAPGGEEWYDFTLAGYRNQSMAGSLSYGMRTEMGLTNDEEALLIEMNDQGSSFDEIANWIEENL